MQTVLRSLSGMGLEGCVSLPRRGLTCVIYQDHPALDMSEAEIQHLA